MSIYCNDLQYKMYVHVHVYIVGIQPGPNFNLPLLPDICCIVCEAPHGILHAALSLACKKFSAMSDLSLAGCWEDVTTHS